MKKGDMRRGQIMDAAEALFFERGYDRTSVQDILSRLGMSKGGFYHYFDAKETVLREICERRWTTRLERLNMELFVGRRSPTDKLNLLLKQANLFEGEDVRFAALMLKICYRARDAAMRDYRRQILTEQLNDRLDETIAEGVAAGVMHTRYPMAAGRLLLLLACDVNDEACAVLAGETDNPDRMIRVIELLNAYREAVEQLCGAPYGSVELFDPVRMVGAWQAAVEELDRLEATEL